MAIIRTKDYRSDIVLTLHMTLGGETVNVPQHDFLLRFFTEHEARHYDCGRIKGEWLHCAPDESDTTLLTCYIKNHGLGCGMLQCLYVDLSPNGGMEDGVQRTFSVSGIDLELVDDASDDTQAVDGSVIVDINAVLTELHDAADAAIASQQKNVASITYIGSNVDGGANTIVITKNDGTRVTGTVYNGHTGATGPQGPQGEQGPQGPAGIVKDVKWDGHSMLNNQGVAMLASQGMQDVKGNVTINNVLKQNVLDALQALNAYCSQNASDISGLEGRTDITFGQMDGGAFYDLEENPITPDSNHLYVDISDGHIYRWGARAYVQVGGGNVTTDSTPTQGSSNPVQSGGVYTALAAKQDALISGTNIKSINGQSLLGGGNVTIAGGEDGKSAYQSYVDTTTDSPVKTEAEWVASLKGEDGHDGVSLGEVAIVNNLTEGGSDKVLSAEMGKVIRMQVEAILSSIGNYAFPNGKPTLDWSGTSVEITTNLVDVISSNPATSVDKNGSYTTTLSGIHEGNLYVMDVVVKMGSVDITSTCFNEETGVVDIPNVTDTIDITATQETYVQDGLVLHLDGKNRGGTAGHWISLVDYNGTPIDFTLTNCDETHDSYVAGNGTTSKGIGSVNTLDVSPTTGTIEAVYNGAEWNSDTLAILHNRGSSTVNHIGLTSWHKSESPYTANDNLLTIAMGSKVNTGDKVAARFTKNAIASGGYVSCIYNSFRINDATSISGYYEGSTQAADSASMLSIFYRKTSSNERFFKLNLYSIRVYNRHLTDEERAQNNRVDKKRFNII